MSCLNCLQQKLGLKLNSRSQPKQPTISQTLMRLFYEVHNTLIFRVVRRRHSDLYRIFSNMPLNTRPTTYHVFVIVGQFYGLKPVFAPMLVGLGINANRERAN